MGKPRRRGMWAARGALKGSATLAATGTLPLGNTLYGVAVRAPSNTVGGIPAAARNVISGNGIGVQIANSVATSNDVIGNFIGTDVSGTLDLGNMADGIEISMASDNVIGGATAVGEGNLISGNNGNGVKITGPGATGNQLWANYIGTNVSGSSDLGNSQDGVYIDRGPNYVGGDLGFSSRNVISGNDSNGIEISTADATGVLVEGNYIGTDVTGTLDLGNTRSGVKIDSAPANTVAGNIIGTEVPGKPPMALGNSTYGVYISSPGNTIGGPSAGSGNAIAYNGGAGVFVADAAGNLVDPNSIHSNGGLGIDLYPSADVTPNDAGDADTGGNNLQNFPVVASAACCGGGTVVTGSLNSLPERSFAIEVFANPACDASGYGEGRDFLGSISVMTNRNGDAYFSGSLLATTVGYSVTATATSSGNDTSEFSQCRTVELDSDGDGVPDSVDNCPTIANPGQQNYVHPATPVGDHCDDPEPDGAYDISDNCPDVANAGQQDGDLDGVGTACDNCPSTSNMRQENFDGDSIGNACDNCPVVTNQDQANNDGDAMGDACDDDDDNDSVADTFDNCQFAANPGQEDSVHPNGIGDACDNPDGDGWPDATDGCPDLATPWSTPLGDADCDAFPSSTYDPGTMRAAEAFMRTNPNAACAATTTLNDENPDPWPMDNNDDRTANLSDILAYIPVFGAKAPPPASAYNPRFDLNQDNGIGLSDILMFIPFFNVTCTP